MKRSILLTLSVFVMLFGSIGTNITASAKPANNGAAAECKNGGWKTLTEIDGKVFKNQGHCVSYVVQGGTTASESGPSYFIGIRYGRTAVDGEVYGSGFEPNTILSLTMKVDSGEIISGPIDLTATETGTFSAGIASWCGIRSQFETSFITFEVSQSGVSFQQQIDLDTYCA